MGGGGVRISDVPHSQRFGIEKKSQFSIFICVLRSFFNLTYPDHMFSLSTTVVLAVAAAVVAITVIIIIIIIVKYLWCM